MSNQDLHRRIKSALIWLRTDHPFFGTLAFHAEIKIGNVVETAGTDGRFLYFNAEFVKGLSKPELLGLLLHEILHIALLHPMRRGTRDPMGWNIAADIVVNGIIQKLTSYQLPSGAVVKQSLAHLSVEEVYEQLPQSDLLSRELRLVDLLSPASSLTLEEEQIKWRSIMAQAQAISTHLGKGFGYDSAGGFRDFEELITPSISWQQILWSFMVSTPCDFEGFDRRFVWQNLYLDAMYGESLKVAIAVDTSGSISRDELGLFIAEVKSILAIYPHITVDLYYCDAEIYGPYEMERGSAQVPPPEGGGGTSFEPFFKRINDEYLLDLCLYFTDGYGLYPSEEPNYETLWVITDGGIVSEDIPFGKVARLSNQPRD